MDAVHFSASDWKKQDRPYINKARKAVEKFVSTGDAMHLNHARNHMDNTAHVGHYGLVLDDLLAQRGTSWEKIEETREREEREALWKSIKADVVELLKPCLSGETRLNVAVAAIKRLGWHDMNAAARECGFQGFDALDTASHKAWLTVKLQEATEVDDDFTWENLVNEIIITDEFYKLEQSMDAFVNTLGGTVEQAQSLDAAWERIL
jgi:hypothetical protein